MLSLLLGTLINIRKIKSCDAIICIVPFTISILPAFLLKRRTNAKLWVHIQDFEFDLAFESGILSKNNFVIRSIRSLISIVEKMLLKQADIVSSISYNMLEKAKNKAPKANLFYFPNWINSEQLNFNETSKKHNYFNSKKFTLLYSGNVGEKQNWNLLLSLCSIIKDKDIEIIIVGDGSYLKTLKEKTEKYEFVKFFPLVPFEELPLLLKSADVHFLFQKTDVLDTVMPSKLLGMLGSAKPCIITGNSNSEVARTFRENTIGFFFDNDDTKNILTAIEKIKNNYWLVVILVLGAALRFYHIDFQSIWLDEIHTMIEGNPSLPYSEFYDVMLLREQMPHLYYNLVRIFSYIFGHSTFTVRILSSIIGILSIYEEAINKIADSLDDIAFALKSGGIPTLAENLENDLLKLRQEISDLEQQKGETYNTLGIIALRNIEVNIENIVGRIKTINQYFNKKEKRKIKKGDVDVAKFVTSQEINIKLLLDNLTFKSSTFRHSVRVAIVMFIGFVVARSLDFAHSYWILLTILVISKPGFSLTKERNYHRIIGTIAGAFIGMAILHYVHDKNTLFVILILFMIAGYSFQRKNYVVSVLFMTPYILIIFEFLGMGTMSIARERIYDTLIGSGIALLASYSLFPNWEHEKVKEAMVDMINANKYYFAEVIKLYFENGSDLTSYKLARKEVFVKSSNLASLFQRMFSEPKSKQVHMQELHQFTVLNHLLSSYVASLSLYIKEHHFICTNYQEIRPIAENTTYLLENASENLHKQVVEPSNVPLIRLKKPPEPQLSDTAIVIEEQFDLIQKVSYDIFKLTEKIKI